MLTSVVVNLGMLGYFKYGGFLLDNFVTIAGSLGIDLPSAGLGHRPSRRDQLLYLRHPLLHARRVSAALGAGAAASSITLCS